MRKKISAAKFNMRFHLAKNLAGKPIIFDLYRGSEITPRYAGEFADWLEEKLIPWLREIEYNHTETVCTWKKKTLERENSSD